MGTIGQYLKEIEGRPGFQIHDVPKTFLYDSNDEIEEEDEIGENFYKEDQEVQIDDETRDTKKRSINIIHKKELYSNDNDY